MPSFTGNHCDERVARIFYLGNSKIDDLLLRSLAFSVPRMAMVGRPASLFGIASIKELNHGAGCGHSSGSVDARPEPETKIVCCHALAVAATSDVDEGTQTRVSNTRQILQTERHNRTIFSDELRDVCHCSDRHNLHECSNLRFAPILAKESVNQFESDSDSGQMLVRIFATCLVGIKHGERGRRAFFFVRQMVIGDDHVETDFAGPIEWFVSAYAAVDADYEFVSIGESFFERCL